MALVTLSGALVQPKADAPKFQSSGSSAFKPVFGNGKVEQKTPPPQATPTKTASTEQKKPAPQQKDDSCECCSKPGHAVDTCRNRCTYEPCETAYQTNKQDWHHYRDCGHLECHNCGGAHFASECTEPAKPKAVPSNCPCCTKPGHTVAECKKRCGANDPNHPCEKHYRKTGFWHNFETGLDDCLAFVSRCKCKGKYGKHFPKFCDKAKAEYEAKQQAKSLPPSWSGIAARAPLPTPALVQQKSTIVAEKKDVPTLPLQTAQVQPTAPATLTGSAEFPEHILSTLKGATGRCFQFSILSQKGTLEAGESWCYRPPCELVGAVEYHEPVAWAQKQRTIMLLEDGLYTFVVQNDGSGKGIICHSKDFKSVHQMLVFEATQAQLTGAV